MPRRLPDLRDQKFGRLTVIGKGEPRKGRSTWLCACECGTHVVIEHTNLNRTHTKSCGCWKREQQTRHGMHDSPEYHTWESMWYRCTNPNAKFWHIYGGKGVRVCDRWRDFPSFYDDMGPRPTLQHSIERVRSSGNYEPGNCKWATPTEQSNNTSRNIYIEHQGETLTTAQWARKLNLNVNTLRNRIKRGWTLDRALVKPAIR